MVPRGVSSTSALISYLLKRKFSRTSIVRLTDRIGAGSSSVVSSFSTWGLPGAELLVGGCAPQLWMSDISAMVRSAVMDTAMIRAVVSFFPRAAFHAWRRGLPAGFASVFPASPHCSLARALAKACSIRAISSSISDESSPDSAFRKEAPSLAIPCSVISDSQKISPR